MKISKNKGDIKLGITLKSLQYVCMQFIKRSCHLDFTVIILWILVTYLYFVSDADLTAKTSSIPINMFYFLVFDFVEVNYGKIQQSVQILLLHRCQSLSHFVNELHHFD